MNFKVKYRKAGAITIEDIEATDKAGVFDILKERGITAISINPGPAAKPKSSVNINWQKLVNWCGIGAGAMGAIGLGVWLFGGSGDGNGSDGDNGKSLIQDVGKTNRNDKGSGSSTNANGNAGNNGNQQNQATNNLPPEVKIEMYRGQPVIKHTTQTNGPYKVERIWTADGNRHRIDTPLFPPDGFGGPTDQLLQMATGAAGGPPIPVAPGMDREFAKAMEKKIEIYPNDSDAVKEMKRQVIEAREQVAEMIKNGSTLKDILEEHQKLTRENQEILAKTQKELDGIMESGDVEGAKKYQQTMEIALQQMGIEGLKDPLTKKEKEAAREEALQRKASRHRKSNP